MSGKLDHILTNDRSFFKSIRVFGGAEPPANSDHRLVVATAALQPYRATRKSFKPQLDSTLLMQNSDLADRYDMLWRMLSVPLVIFRMIQKKHGQSHVIPY